MRKQTTLRSLSACVALVLGGALVQTAHANPRSEAQARYEHERAQCLDGQSNQSRHDCLREAAAAYQEALRGRLGTGDDTDYRANQFARCEALRGDEHSACIARMQGQGTVSGSVAAGGLYRELVTVEPTPPQ